MTTNLFRREAVKAHTERNNWGTTLVVPLSTTSMVLFALGLAVSIILFLLFGEYSPKDTVRGYVTTTEGNVRVFAPGDGTIQSLMVEEGTSVREGQPLLSLRTSRIVGQSDEARDSILGALEAEKSALLREIEGIRNAGSSKELAYRNEIESLQHRLRILEEQRATLQRAADIAQRAVDRLNTMESSGFVSDRDFDNAQAELTETQIRLKASKIDNDDVRAAIRRTRAALDEHPFTLMSRISEKESEYQRLEARLAEGLAISRQTVTAPADGIVTGLLVRPGQTISAQKPLLSVVPDEGTFYAELLIPTRTIGFVKTGARVSIRYDAFPYQKFGTYDGVVEHIARTTTLPGDKLFPLPLSESVFVARVKILQQSVSAYTQQHALQSGMTFTADIKRDRRRMIEWLFDPLISAQRRL